MSPEPKVTIPLSRYGAAPPCPACGYGCGCCCHDNCQTPCPTPDEYGDCDCTEFCHGGHEPWDCYSFGTRYAWVKKKAAELEQAQND